jgi:hypothetical protein
MTKNIPMQRFLQALLGDRNMAAQAAEIGRAILAARSLRRTEVAAKMRGKAEAAYKRIQRFLRRVDPQPVLRRLFREEAEAHRGGTPPGPEDRIRGRSAGLQDTGLLALALGDPPSGAGHPLWVGRR